MRIVYFGSPQVAVPPLEALLRSGHDVPLVVTNPDRRRGRGGRATPTPVGAFATSAGVAVSHDPADATGVGAELGVVVAYGRLLRSEVLDALPVVNLHFSLLPRWRGAAPVERAILAGDAATGVCLMEVTPTLDTGGVYRSTEIAIGPTVTATELAEELSGLGASMLVAALAEGLGRPEPQDPSGVTYAEKLTPEDRHLDWSQPADDLDRVVRVGGSWTTFRGERLVVLRATPVSGTAVAGRPGEVVGDVDLRVACGSGTALDILELRPAGRSTQRAAEFRRGARLRPGERLGG